MTTDEILEYEWPYLLTFLPEERELEHTARSCGAIARKRHISQASTLLRLAFVYSCCGMSLRQTAAWAQEHQVAELSDVALLKRLRAAASWMETLLAIKLAETAPPPDVPARAARLRLVDATCISPPGASTDFWRVHMGIDLARLTINHIELTSRAGGESLRRVPVTPGEIVLADRGYARRPGLEALVRAGADFLVRIPWQPVPLRHRDGSAFDLFAFLRGLEDAQPGDLALEMPASTPNGTPMPVRLLALRKSEHAAGQSRATLLAAASKRGDRLDPRSLEAAGYFLALTSVPADVLSAQQAADLYRFRWQIELAFKRLKSLLHLDVLPAKDPDLARTTIAAKLLAALVLDNLTQAFLDFSPWGYRCRTTQPLALAHPEDAG
jgi:hypothetical protein